MSSLGWSPAHAGSAGQSRRRASSRPATLPSITSSPTWIRESRRAASARPQHVQPTPRGRRSAAAQPAAGRPARRSAATADCTTATILSLRCAACSTSSRDAVGERATAGVAGQRGRAVRRSADGPGRRAADRPATPGRPGRSVGSSRITESSGRARRRSGRTGTAGPRPRRAGRTARRRRNIAVRPSRRNAVGAGRARSPRAGGPRSRRSSSAGCADLAGQQRRSASRARSSDVGRRLGQRPTQGGLPPSSSRDRLQFAAQRAERVVVQRRPPTVSSRSGRRLAGRPATGDVLHQRSSSARNRSTVRFCRASSDERLTDDLAGQLDRGAAEVGPQLGDDLRRAAHPAGRDRPRRSARSRRAPARACRRGWPGPGPGRPRGSWPPPRGRRPAAGWYSLERGRRLVLGLLRPWRCRPRWPRSGRRRPSRTSARRTCPARTSRITKRDRRDQDFAPRQADRVGRLSSAAYVAAC